MQIYACIANDLTVTRLYRLIIRMASKSPGPTNRLRPSPSKEKNIGSARDPCM